MLAIACVTAHLVQRLETLSKATTKDEARVLVHCTAALQNVTYKVTVRGDRSSPRPCAAGPLAVLTSRGGGRRGVAPHIDWQNIAGCEGVLSCGGGVLGGAFGAGGLLLHGLQQQREVPLSERAPTHATILPPASPPALPALRGVPT